MPNIEWSDVAAEAMERDAREFPFGYLTGGSFVMDSVQVFVWFKSLEDLLQHIRDVEPRVYDLEPGQGLKDYQMRVGPLLESVRADGFAESLRLRLNAAVNEAFVVDWWGRYDELRTGRGEFARELLDHYLDEDRRGQVLPEDEEGDFVEYLTTCGI